MADRKNLFENMPVSRAVWTLCIPNILSMMTSVLYNLVDVYFIAQIGDANQVAAVSLCAPVSIALMGIGNVFGIGGSTYMSRSQGEGQYDRVKKISSFCFWTAIAIGVFCAVLMAVGMEPLLKLLGATDATRTFCRQYEMWITIGAPIIVLNYVTSNHVRALGGSRETMIGMMIGTFTNIILDPIMIFVLNLGVAGAAAATVLGNLCADLYFIVYVNLKEKAISMNPKDYSASWNRIVKPVIVVGIPAALTNIMSSVANVLLNNKLVSFADGETIVAGLSVAMKINSIATMIMIAIAFGVQPLLGYCYGAKNKKRFNASLKYVASAQILIGTILALFIEILAGPLVRFFMDQADVVRYGTYILRVMSVSVPFVGILTLLTNLFQAMGKGVPSMVLSLSRQGILYVPLLFIMDALFAYQGVVWAQPTADIAGFVLALILYAVIMKKETWGEAAGA